MHYLKFTLKIKNGIINIRSQNININKNLYRKCSIYMFLLYYYSKNTLNLTILWPIYLSIKNIMFIMIFFLIF